MAAVLDLHMDDVAVAQPILQSQIIEAFYQVTKIINLRFYLLLVAEVEPTILEQVVQAEVQAEALESKLLTRELL